MRTGYLSMFVCLLVSGLLSTSTQALDIYDTWVQGALVRGRTVPGHTIEFMKRTVKVTREGYFVVGIGRDTKSEVSLRETMPNGQSILHRFAVKQRKYKEQRINGVPKKTVDVPETALKRIRSEQRLVGAARKVHSQREDFRDVFEWPLTGPITGVYGSRRVYNGQPRRPHYGIDIAAPTGTLVKAPVAGVVTLVHQNMYFSGGTLIVDHGHGVSSTFIHLNKVLVKEGDQLKKGDIIAEVGATGRATGPHLDWRMNWFNQRLDPQLLVKPMIIDTANHK